MDAKILSNVVVSINNAAIVYVPGSLKYEEGLGTTMLKPQAGGGGQIQMAVAEDITTKIGKVSFDLIPTNENIGLARTWKNNVNANVIKLSASGSSFSKTFTQMAVVNSPEIGLSADGKLTLEFNGNPAV